MSKTLFVESTKVPMERTLALIQKMLAEHGALAIMSEYENEQISGMAFRIKISEQFVAFKVPCRWRQILKLLKYKSYGVEDEVRARRIAWRQIYWWLKAQMALVDTEMVQLAEVFLPYAQYRTGETVFEHLEQRHFKQLEHQTDASQP